MLAMICSLLQIKRLMKSPIPRPYTDSRRPKIAFIVEHKSGTRRIRKFFTTETDAKAYCKGVERKQRELGFDDAALLSPEAAREAVECLKRLKTANASLTQAVEHYLAWQEAGAASRPTAAAVTSWLGEVERQQARGELKERTVQHYKRIKKFSSYFKNRPLATITLPDFKKWVNSIKGTSLTKNHYRAVTSTFYTWAVTEGIATDNIALRSPKLRTNSSGGEPIRANGLRLAFDLATGHLPDCNFNREQQRELTAWLALGAFAGLRASEVFRAKWEHLKFDLGQVWVPVAKSKQPRRVPMLPAARAWLATVAKNTGPIITDKNFENNGPLKVLRAAMRSRGEDWPANGLRKAFATCHYLLEAGEDGRKTCLATGHSNESTFEGYYLRGFTKEEAAEVWAIRPRTKRGKIVKFATA
jgi:integrase